MVGRSLALLEDNLMIRIFETITDSTLNLFYSCAAVRTSLYCSRLLCEAIITQLAQEQKLSSKLLSRSPRRRVSSSFKIICSAAD